LKTPALTRLDLDEVVVYEHVARDGILALVLCQVLEYECLLVDVTRLGGEDRVEGWLTRDGTEEGH
jgi:hypothetical protein